MPDKMTTAPLWIGALMMMACTQPAPSAATVSPATPAEPPAPAPVPADETMLVGLWGAERSFDWGGVQVTVHADGDGLYAAAEGARARATTDGDEVSFTLPRDQGSFRGRRSKDGTEIAGHWIQSSGVTFDYGFATPLVLRATQSGVWEGSVEPFEDRLSLYISIRRDDEGRLRTLLRNPERNLGVFLRIDSVTRSGDALEFVDAQGQGLLTGRIDEESGVFSVTMSPQGVTFDFRRRERDAAAGYYPRPETNPYRYQAPRPTGDGWATGSAQAVGLSESRLSALAQSIMNAEPTSLRTPYVHSLLVARRGKLVLEEYFHGFHAGRPHDLRSAGKSLTGLMTGVAIAEVDGLDVDTPVYSLLGEPGAELEPRKAAMTVEHLLTMSSGYECDDNDDQSQGNEDRMQSQSEQPDWRRYTLDLPMARAPGAKAVYCTGGINLLGAVVSRTTKTWLPEFFRTQIAGPLGIERYHYNLDPVGNGYGGGGVYLRPRDMLKVGQMVLDGGTWKGTRVVPKEWIDQSLQPRVGINHPDDYGYTWWHEALPYRGGTVHSYAATGNGGQILVIVPELELVVGFMGGNYSDFATWIGWFHDVVPKYVLDAVDDASARRG
ncbi:MAG: beta-lactamase family protein [Deltaproteobacteria bacterium]|nr:beta-lactamase family protein [Deltaproteobacteria bacterium]